MSGGKNTLVFDEIKNAVANIFKVNYYDANRETRVKFDANDNGWGATLEQQQTKDRGFGSRSNPGT